MQDYEPGFHAWSSEYALARSTYHAGFIEVVNSSPVRDYLQKFEQITVPDERVFRPSLDMDLLEKAAAERKVDKARPSIVFYARPEKPRNMYAVGMAALQLAALELKRDGIDIRVSTFGDAHPVPTRGVLTSLNVRGKLPWADYFQVLSTTDIALSLQMSPHPSHPPLDMVVAGGISVTNDLDGMRGGLDPRLVAAEASPQALAASLVSAVTMVREDEVAGERFRPQVIGGLGRPLDALLDDLSWVWRV